MMPFHSIKELINSLAIGKDLLSEMFEKRRALAYKYEDAINLLDEEKVHVLIDRSIIRQNGQYIEIDESFMQFFEQILEVNEEINVSYINEHIRSVKENINYYLQENSENRKYNYLKTIKSALRKIGRVTLRNVIDLNRNIDNTFKTEPNYKIKIAKLENHDRRRQDIKTLIAHTEKLITEDEQVFFRSALDEELKQVITRLRQELIESGHNLVEMEKQIIEFLNQIKFQSGVNEKIRQIKYLKDQIELKSRTNILEVLRANQAVALQASPSYHFKLSLDFLQSDDAHESLVKIARRFLQGAKPALPNAEGISSDYLEIETEEEIFINLEELKNSFSASGNHLVDFVMNYRFPREVDFSERVTLFCQVISLYEKDLDILETYSKIQDIEFAVVYPK